MVIKSQFSISLIVIPQIKDVPEVSNTELTVISLKKVISQIMVISTKLIQDFRINARTDKSGIKDVLWLV
jgi:hypothetical protein